MVDIRHSSTVHVGEFDDEVLPLRPTELDGAGRGVRGREGQRAEGMAAAAAVRDDLEVVAPHAGTLQARTFAAVGLELVAFHLAFAAGQTSYMSRGGQPAQRHRHVVLVGTA